MRSQTAGSSGKFGLHAVGSGLVHVAMTNGLTVTRIYHTNKRKSARIIYGQQIYVRPYPNTCRAVVSPILPVTLQVDIGFSTLTSG